jgi:hypothetical protein
MLIAWEKIDGAKSSYPHRVSNWRAAAAQLNLTRRSNRLRTVPENEEPRASNSRDRGTVVDQLFGEQMAGAAFAKRFFGARHHQGKTVGLEEAHRDLKISPAEFDEVAAELGRSLDFANVPAREKGEVLAAFAMHENEVTAGYTTK